MAEIKGLLDDVIISENINDVFRKYYEKKQIPYTIDD